MGIWDNVQAGFDLGSETGRRLRDRRAYRDGGLAGVEQAAGRAGDLEDMEYSRGMQRRQLQFEDSRTQAAYQRMQEISPLALGALDRVAQLPVGEQRQSFLMAPHIRQRFIDWGIQPDQYDGAVQAIMNDQTGEAIQGFRAAFQQHENPDWQISNVTGDIFRVGEDGQPVMGGQAPGAEKIRRGAELALRTQERQANAPYPQGRGGGIGGQAPSGDPGQFSMRDLSAQERNMVLDAAAASRQATSMAQRLQRFAALNRTQATGGLQRFNIVSPEAQEMRSITEGLISFLRNPGEGTMSDADVERFRATLPSLANNPQANTAIIEAFSQVQQNAAGYSEFIEMYVQQNGTVLGASELWNEYLTSAPIFDTVTGEVNANRPNWRQFFGLEGGAPQPQQNAGPRRRRYNAETGDIR